jgi:hypothetical protein
MNGYQVAQVPPAARISLHYVHNFISNEEIQNLVALCDNRDGWVASPQRNPTEENPANEAEIVVDKRRTSSSCPLLWPVLYLSSLDKIIAAGKLTADLEAEIDLTWALTQRFAELLEVEVNRIEPLQLIRYEAGQYYRKHHDHGKYYGLGDAHRAMTMVCALSYYTAVYLNYSYFYIPILLMIYMYCSWFFFLMSLLMMVEGILHSLCLM